MKLRYLDLSKTIRECKEVANNFPEIANLASKKAKPLIDEQIAKAKKAILNEWISYAKRCIANAKEYIINDDIKSQIAVLETDLQTASKKAFDKYISLANSKISSENFDNAKKHLNNAESCIINDNQRQTYNLTLSSYKYKYDDYIKRNTSWTYGYKYQYKSDGALIYNLNIYKNSSKYKEKSFFIRYHPYEDVYNKAYYDVYFGLGENIVTFYPDQRKGYVTSGNSDYYGSSLDDCVDFAIKAYIKQKYR